MELLDLNEPIEEVAGQVKWYQFMWWSTGVVEQTHKHSSTIHYRFPRLGVPQLLTKSFMSLSNSFIYGEKDMRIPLIDAEIHALRRKKPQRMHARNIFAKDLMNIALNDIEHDPVLRRQTSRAVIQQSTQYFSILSEESQQIYEREKDKEVERRETLIDNKIKLLEREREELKEQQWTAEKKANTRCGHIAFVLVNSRWQRSMRYMQVEDIHRLS